MENFIFNIPTIAYVRIGQISNLETCIKQFGGTKVLLAFGGGSALDADKAMATGVKDAAPLATVLTI
jgi:alcohol dehydrogenase YqhD (iron-dependent ADH family)